VCCLCVCVPRSLLGSSSFDRSILALPSFIAFFAAMKSASSADVKVVMKPRLRTPPRSASVPVAKKLRPPPLPMKSASSADVKVVLKPRRPPPLPKGTIAGELQASQTEQAAGDLVSANDRLASLSLTAHNLRLKQEQIAAEMAARDRVLYKLKLKNRSRGAPSSSDRRPLLAAAKDPVPANELQASSGTRAGSVEKLAKEQTARRPGQIAPGRRSRPPAKEQTAGGHEGLLEKHRFWLSGERGPSVQCMSSCGAIALRRAGSPGTVGEQ